jgi:hypothetical protein
LHYILYLLSVVHVDETNRSKEFLENVLWDVIPHTLVGVYQHYFKISVKLLPDLLTYLLMELSAS